MFGILLEVIPGHQVTGHHGTKAPANSDGQMGRS